ncbi:hypothetical protein ASPVEDRAFT_29570 [Aspergillus versicolor CBS 583.65]|uniref:Zona occludens toxin N-terminal domain-containing protein n=1 Tax=Aspergillus versicolor CBS 583.65 TaxID=1036611 RepID=A0A1L9PNQ2_ASPVE|nr:uncharacterized protein ASPVEDRAFT_29570 [Aspergillus versicolor CBS 583.65]OJJ03035.1 hypothetical protein ASPVEDRAFT_29570 [Aspergillus versicolor CBS 583.65]
MSPYSEEAILEDPRLFFNVASPSSTFICGSQGSGKSHTLSCMLEGCLIPSRAGKLHKPMAGVVFHYDTFISDSGGSPCEAAFLASHSSVNVRVLCAPTNLETIKKTYARFNIPVEPLLIDQAHLNTKRMFDLMAVGQGQGPAPLYVHTVQRILREMRILQQSTGSRFDYRGFKRRVLDSDLLPGQLEPLKQRLDPLESFMPLQQAVTLKSRRKGMAGSNNTGSSWTPKRSRLTIVDLSCPCISPDTACSLFNVCFGIFMEQDTEIGRVVALDEAHKYMKDSIEARTFTDTLLSTVRLQRHLGARILISTQEPTISSDLLGLCTVTIVHRFTSPAWLRALKGHVAAAAMEVKSRELPNNSEDEAEGSAASRTSSLFRQIVHLRVGEALLFSPSAVVGASEGHRLGDGYMVIKVRDRLTEDGGKSVISS